MMTEKKYVFQSDRLGFRNWSQEDIAPMSIICADREVMRYFPSTLSYDETKSFLERMQFKFQEKRYCYFAVDTLHDQQLIGLIGLCDQEYKAPFTPCVDIGWRLATEAWGNGYATEGARRCLKYAFETINLKEIFAIASEVNEPSINIMKKIGMKRFTRFEHPKLKEYQNIANCLCYKMTNPNITKLNEGT